MGLFSDSCHHSSGSLSNQEASDRTAMVNFESHGPTLIVTGNPNVGKSVIFQLLTGRYVTVSNYPGTTVMVSRGSSSLGGVTYQAYDTPGFNSMIASSEDELVARNLLLGIGEKQDAENNKAVVIQVSDAKNLSRALVLTIEFAEAGLETVLVLNMIDEARERRIDIDADRLAQMLNIPVVSTIATQRFGIERLRKTIPKARRPLTAVRYPAIIEEALRQMEQALTAGLARRRAIALLWLAGDSDVVKKFGAQLDASTVETLSRIASSAQARSSSRLGLLISHARLREASRLSKLVMSAPSREHRPWLDKFGMLAMHKFWGIPILMGVLWLMYVLVGDIAAQRGVDFFENVVFARYVTPMLSWLIQTVIPWAWLRELFVGEYGLFTMALPYAFAIILPIVTMFFLCFGLIEDVGYLPRLAVVANRFCRLLGLNGKAVLPLVLGLGCDTMATMTSRILDSKRDRIIVTLLLALGIPCSAQLGVIMSMLAGRPMLALIVWASVLLIVIIVVGQVAARLIGGQESPFLYEIPPLRRPKLSNVIIKTLGRVEWYIKEAVPLFFLGTFILFVLDKAGTLLFLERLCAPVVVSWLGLPEKTTAAFLIGFLRRDFGAAGLFALERSGALSGLQIVVSLVTITLFVPCIAQYFMMVKERGWKMASAMALFVFAVALLTGGILFRLLSVLGLSL